MVVVETTIRAYRGGVSARGETPARIVENGHYLVWCDDKPMRLLERSLWRLPLAPGEVQVCHLPASRIVLALEPKIVPERADPSYRTAPSEDHGPSVDHAALTAALATAHHFDVRWLPQNRDGELARGQMRRAFSDLGPTLIATSLLAGAGILIAVCASGMVAIVFGGFFGILALLAVADSLSVSWRLLRDALAGKVQVLEGPVQLDVQPTPRSAPTYCYVVGEERIRVDADGARALVPGVRYRVWVLPRSRRIVGIEPAEGGGVERGRGRR